MPKFLLFLLFFTPLRLLELSCPFPHPLNALIVRIILEAAFTAVDGFVITLQCVKG